MSRTASGVLFGLVIVVLVVTVDVLFFRHHAWARLAANVGIVLLVAGFYLRFRHGS